MGNVVTGVIQEIKTKNTSTGKQAFDVVVAGQSYGVGLYAPKARVGDYVKFEIDDSRGYQNVARNSLQVSKNKAPPEAVAQAAATAPKMSTGGGTVDMKQEIISRQSAKNTAIEFMKVLQAAGALPVPAAKGKAQEALEIVFREYEKQFYESNTGVAFKDITPTTPTAIAATEVAVAQPEVVADATEDEWK